MFPTPLPAARPPSQLVKEGPATRRGEERRVRWKAWGAGERVGVWKGREGEGVEEERMREESDGVGVDLSLVQ